MNPNNGHPMSDGLQKQNPSTPPKPQSAPNDLKSLAQQTWSALLKMNDPKTPHEERQNCDHFLSKIVPNQAICWQVFSTFLNTKNAPHEVHFFAANMLRSKIQRNLHQVPAAQQQGLHDMLLSALKAFNQRGTEYENVRTQIAIAVALLAIQRTDWTNEVQNIVDQLAKQETLDILLNILTRLPEELYHFTIPISIKHKDVASANLKNHAPLVLRLLKDLFAMVSANKGQHKTNVKIFKCFAAWLRFMDNHFTEYMTNYKVLTKYCFESLSNDDLFDEAVTCISRILKLSDGDTSSYYDEYDDEHKVNQKAQQQNQLIQENFELMVPNIIALKPMYDKAVKEDDDTRVNGLTRLFCDVAEQNVAWIVQSDQDNDQKVAQLLQIVVQCSGHRDPNIAVYACYFWAELFHPFIRAIRKIQPHDTQSWDHFDRQWPSWAERFVLYPASSNGKIGLIPSILPNLVKAARLPEDFDEMNEEEAADAVDLRWQISDNVAAICEIIGLYAVLEILSNLLESFCVKDPGKPMNYDNDSTMERIYRCEAILFCVQSGPKCDPYERHMRTDQLHPLLRIFSQLQRLPQHFIIRRAAVRLIESHLSFLEVTDDVFTFAYQYTLKSLDEPRCHREALRTIRSFCKQIGASALPQGFTNALFAIYDSKWKSLKQGDQMVLVEAMALLISSCRDLKLAREGVEQLLKRPRLHLTQMLEAVTNGQLKLPVTASEKADGVEIDGFTLYDTINVISCVFKHFQVRYPSDYDGDNISVSLLDSLWPPLQRVLSMFTVCDGIMEKTTRIIKHVIRNGGSKKFSSSKICLDALRLLTDLYCTKSQRSSFLYIVWIYVEEYMDIPQAANELMQTLVKLTQCTFSGPLRDEKSFFDNVDIVEDFYELIVQYIRKAHHYIIQNPSFLATLFERSICGLLLDHQKAHDGIYKFIEETICMGRERSEQHQGIVDELLYGQQNYAQRIVLKILRGLCGEVRRDRASTLADLLNCIYKYDRNRENRSLERHLEEMVKQLVAQRVKSGSRDPTKHEFVEMYFVREGDSRSRYHCAMDWYDANYRWKQQCTF